MSDTKSILIAGVGGQGSLLASRVLGSFYAAKGLSVKVSEVHGMSQRGGSVVTYVRAGSDVASPIITLGGADAVISFEILEALRYVPYLKKGGRLITSTQQIDPMPVITGAAGYPSDIAGRLEKEGVRAVFVDAMKFAAQSGTQKAANIVMLGAASPFLGGSEKEWDDALAACIKPQFLEMNRTAFSLGRAAAA